MFDTSSLAPEAGEDSPSGASLRGPHRLAAIETCERMWALRYFWFIRLAKENPWRLGGSLIHTYYQYWYASMMAEPPSWFHSKSLNDALREQAQAIAEPERSKLLQMAFENFMRYRVRYENDAQYLRPFAIEEEFSATLGELDPGGPWPELDNDVVTCRSDLVYETENGLWIMDYKTHGRSKVNPRTGMLTRWKEDGEYALNWQVLMNLLILRRRFGDARVRGFVIQRSTRQEPYDFDRHVLTIPLDAYNDAPRVARELVRREHEVMAKLDQGGRPSPRFHACYGKYGPCDYRYACLAPSKVVMNERLRGPEFSQAPTEEIMRARARLRVVR